MKRKSVAKLNLILAFGILFILSGFFLLVHFSKRYFDEFPLLPVLLITLGTAVLYSSLTFFKKAFVFFIGFYVALLGIFTLFMASTVCPFSFSQLWPLAAILCSFSLFVTSFFKHRRVAGSYVYPSIAIGVLGIIFLLFSSDVVKLSFSSFMAEWWPIFLVMFGIVLVVLFLIQEKTENFPYTPDDDGIGDMLG